MSELTRIQVQTQDFSLATEYDCLRGQSDCGAIVSFIGMVRDLNDGSLDHLELEHYPAMTEKSLHTIVNEARKRWQLGKVTLIHRVGKLHLGEQIVLVLTSSAHRDAAFAANEFIMDFLKTRAPFWKKETTDQKSYWVAAKASDNEATLRWNN